MGEGFGCNSYNVSAGYFETMRIPLHRSRYFFLSARRTHQRTRRPAHVSQRVSHRQANSHHQPARHSVARCRRRGWGYEAIRKRRREHPPSLRAVLPKAVGHHDANGSDLRRPAKTSECCDANRCVQSIKTSPSPKSRPWRKLSAAPSAIGDS